MRVLFLDDDPGRCAIAALRYPRACIVHTAADCIAALHDTWDEVHLDHDLGGTQMQNSDREDSGMEVVRYVEDVTARLAEFNAWAAEHDAEADDVLDEELPPQVRVGKFVIHSWNHVAAPVMAERLAACGYQVERKAFRGMF